MWLEEIGFQEEAPGCYVCEYLLFATCLSVLLPIWYMDGRFSKVEFCAEAEARYSQQVDIPSLLGDCADILALDRPKDPMRHLEDYLHERRLRERQEREDRRFGTAALDKRHPSKDRSPSKGKVFNRGVRKRSVHAQFLVFALAQGLFALYAGLAHHRINLLLDSGDGYGRQWSSEHSEWMYFWLLAASIAPVATMSAAGMVLAFLLCPDWMIHMAHIVGVVVALVEASVIIGAGTNKITGKIVGCLGTFVFSAASVAIVNRIVRYPQIGFGQGRGALLLGVGLLLLGSLIATVRAALACDAPQTDMSMLLDIILIAAVLSLFVAMHQRAGVEIRDLPCIRNGCGWISSAGLTDSDSARSWSCCWTRRGMVRPNSAQNWSLRGKGTVPADTPVMPFAP